MRFTIERNEWLFNTNRRMEYILIMKKAFHLYLDFFYCEKIHKISFSDFNAITDIFNESEEIYNINISLMICMRKISLVYNPFMTENILKKTDDLKHKLNVKTNVFQKKKTYEIYI